MQILEELKDLCHSHDCAHEQRLLRNMKAHEVVLELLQVPYNKVGLLKITNRSFHRLLIVY